MQDDRNAPQDNQQAGQGYEALPDLLGPAVFGEDDATKTGGWSDRSATAQVMDLAFEITRTSADIYELVAEFAGAIGGSPYGGLRGDPDVDHDPNHGVGHHPNRPVFQGFAARLGVIIGATQVSSRRAGQLESKIVRSHPEIFDAFLEDCWAALDAFREVGEHLGGIIRPNDPSRSGLDAPDGNGSTAVTYLEVLKQVMDRLETCSEKVSGLPATGMAVSYKCLVKSVFTLQRHAGDLVERSASIS